MSRADKQPSKNGYYYSLEPSETEICDAYVYDDFETSKRYVVLTCQTDTEANYDVPLMQMMIGKDGDQLWHTNPELSGKAAWSQVARDVFSSRKMLLAFFTFQQLCEDTPPFPDKSPTN